MPKQRNMTLKCILLHILFYVFLKRKRHLMVTTCNYWVWALTLTPGHALSETRRKADSRLASGREGKFYMTASASFSDDGLPQHPLTPLSSPSFCFCRYVTAVNLRYDGALGSGVGYWGSRAGQSHVCAASPAVWWHWRTGRFVSLLLECVTSCLDSCTASG